MCQVDLFHYPIHNGIQVVIDFMAPESQHRPSMTSQALEIQSVSMSVPFDLVLPIFLEFVFPKRKAPAVPKIAVHEHDQFDLGEHEIRLAGQRRNTTTIAQAAFVQRRTDDSF
jgi:hypothetical protein